MKPIELEDRLKVGMKVKVIIFGEGQSYTGRKEFEGIVGELGCYGMGFFVWNNTHNNTGYQTNNQDYTENYYIAWTNENVDIIILDLTQHNVSDSLDISNKDIKKMRPIELEGKLKVGDKIRINHYKYSYVEGIVGEICHNGFYFWNDEIEMTHSEGKPKGYKFAYYISWKYSPSEEIYLIEEITKRRCKMKVSEAKGILKVGDIVKTNGSCGSAGGNLITGEIGEITDQGFYIFQNCIDGAIGNINPTSRGYKYSWAVWFDCGEDVWIEILNTEARADTVADIVENKMTKYVYEVLVIDKEANKILLNETVIGTTTESITTSTSINNAEMLKKIKSENLFFLVRSIGSYEEVKK